jgi:DNA-binding PadR family transcriptional regulator
MINPGDPPEKLWRAKLELDVLEECRVDPPDFDELMDAFTDEDGDSTTSPEELREILDALESQGLVVSTTTGGRRTWRTAPKGMQRLRQDWPGFKD